MIRRKVYSPVYANEEVIYRIPVTWQMRAIIPVSASSLKEAFQLVNTLEYDLPEGEYVEDTYEIDYDRLEEERGKHHNMKKAIEPENRNQWLFLFLNAYINILEQYKAGYMLFLTLTYIDKANFLLGLRLLRYYSSRSLITLLA